MCDVIACGNIRLNVVPIELAETEHYLKKKKRTHILAISLRLFLPQKDLNTRMYHEVSDGTLEPSAPGFACEIQRNTIALQTSACEENVCTQCSVTTVTMALSLLAKRYVYWIVNEPVYHFRRLIR